MVIGDGNGFPQCPYLDIGNGLFPWKLLLLGNIKSEQSSFSPLFTKEMQKYQHKGSASSKEPMLRLPPQTHGANNSSASANELHE